MMEKEVFMTKDGIPGYKSPCPQKLKDSLRRAVDYTCMECLKKEDEVGLIEPHRIIRGYKGGLYTIWPPSVKGSNIKMVCKNCHKKYHEKEF